MPSRKKVKSAKKPKRDVISINIKNVVKQVQNERQRTDFLFPQRDPKRNLNMGSMTRLINPAITYASTPLSAFPTLQSLISANPQSQLKSRSDIPVTAPPIISPNDIRNDDAMVPVMRETRITQSVPLLSGYSTFVSTRDPVITALPAPIERYIVPTDLPSRLADSYDGKEDPVQVESNRAVAAAMDPDFINKALYARAWDSDEDTTDRAMMTPDLVRNMDNVEAISRLYARLREEKAGSPIIPVINRQIKKLEKKRF